MCCNDHIYRQGDLGYIKRKRTNRKITLKIFGHTAVPFRELDIKHSLWYRFGKILKDSIERTFLVIVMNYV